MKERKDDFNKRRAHLKNMNDQELKDYFYQLSDKMIAPLIDHGYKNTSPSIERSVLLRMGFSSIQAKAIVNMLHEHDLLRKGAGHCVYKVSNDKNIDIIAAGVEIQDGKHIDYLKEVFKVYEKNSA